MRENSRPMIYSLAPALLCAAALVALCEPLLTMGTAIMMPVLLRLDSACCSAESCVGSQPGSVWWPRRRGQEANVLDRCGGRGAV